MIIEGALLKIGKKEHLEELIKGNVYFKEANYFRGYEIDKSKDSREGKIRINPNDTAFPEDSMLKLISELNIEELNISHARSGKTPIFCCSVVDENILKKVSEDEYRLSDEFIKEMTLWGKTLVIISMKEFCDNINKACSKLGIMPLMVRVLYNQEDNYPNNNDLLEIIRSNKYLAFFHKTKDYKLQNEFRIVIASNTLIDEKSDHYILKIDKLKNAKIFELEDLSDLQFKSMKQCES